jgi:hypothetical protein
MSICKHFTNIFKDHLKNEYDEYEIIFYKFNYNITNFRNFKIPINTDKQKIVYILFDENELYYQKNVDTKINKSKLTRLFYLIF